MLPVSPYKKRLKVENLVQVMNLQYSGCYARSFNLRMRSSINLPGWKMDEFVYKELLEKVDMNIWTQNGRALDYEEITVLDRDTWVAQRFNHLPLVRS